MLERHIDFILTSKTQSSPPAPPPLPSRRWVGLFAKNGDSAADLPLLERIKLQIIADWIVECGQPGAYPVVTITAVGYSEADESYAQAVSLKRASSVLEELRKEIRDRTKPPVGFNLPSLDTTIQFQPKSFGSIGNKRVVELIFERGQYTVPRVPAFSIVELTEQVMRWAKYQFPPPPQPPLKWWKLPTVRHKDQWRDIVNYLRNDTFLKYLDLKTIVEGMWNAAQGDPALDPKAGDEERQKATEKWVEELAEEWMKYNRDLQQRTANPPGDPEDPPEPTDVPPTRHVVKTPVGK